MMGKRWDAGGSEKNAFDPRSPTSGAVSEMDGEAEDPLQAKSALIVALAMLVALVRFVADAFYVLAMSVKNEGSEFWETKPMRRVWGA
jgi:hypothetical protein